MDIDGFSINDGDCDDLNPDINPNADEQCDEIDNDCDGLIDENIPLPANTVYFIDADEDGYGEKFLFHIKISTCHIV